MTAEEMKDHLKNHLKVEVDTNSWTVPPEDGCLDSVVHTRTKVMVKWDDEVISETETSHSRLD